MLKATIADFKPRARLSHAEDWEAIDNLPVPWWKAEETTLTKALLKAGAKNYLWDDKFSAHIVGMAVIKDWPKSVISSQRRARKYLGKVNVTFAIIQESTNNVPCHPDCSVDLRVFCKKLDITNLVYLPEECKFYVDIYNELYEAAEKHRNKWGWTG